LIIDFKIVDTITPTITLLWREKGRQGYGRSGVDTVQDKAIRQK